MKFLKYALIGAATLTLSGCALTEQISHGDVTTQEQAWADDVIAQEMAWADALVASDLDIVANLMHPHFRLVRTYNSEAPPISREMYLGMPGMSVQSYVIERTDVTITDTVAVVDMIMSLDWKSEELGPLPPRFHLIDTWLKMDDDWKIIARVSQVALEETGETE